MDFRKLFTGKPKQKATKEEKEEAQGFLEKHKNNPQTIAQGLTMLRSMPKSMQKAVLMTLPKAEREIAKKHISGELDIDPESYIPPEAKKVKGKFED